MADAGAAQKQGSAGGKQGGGDGGGDDAGGEVGNKLRKIAKEHAKDDIKMLAALKELVPAWQGPLARMVLSHALSEEKAEELWAAAHGGAEPSPAPPEPKAKAGPAAQLALAHAGEVGTQLYGSLKQMQAAPDQMMGPLHAVPPNVAAAAMTQLHQKKFDAKRSAYQVLDEMTQGGAKTLLAKGAAGGDDDKEKKKIDFHSGPAQAWASKIVAAMSAKGAIDSALEVAANAPAWASLRVALRQEPSKLPAMVAQLLDQVENLLRSMGSGEIVPAELASRIAAVIGPVTAQARLHTGPDADKAAGEHGAAAVAIGEDVFFASGQFKPGSPEGDFLIAHELAHVAQAQQKSLDKAAPFAINSGRVVNDSEVEADLAARLVVARGSYTTSVPAAPGPTGFATDDGQRAAQLGAQQARIQLASGGGGGGGGDGAAAAAPAAAGGGGGGDAPPAPAPAPGATNAVAGSGSAEAYTSVFASPPSQHPDDWDGAGDKASTQLKTEEDKAVAEVPSFDAEMEGKDSSAKAGDAGGGANAKVDAKGEGANPTVTPPPMPTLPPPTGNTAGTAQLADKVGEDKAKLKTEGLKTISQLQTKDPDLKTAPGPSPVVELSGESDPAQTVAAEGQAQQQTHDELDKQREKILAGPGPAQVQPLKVDEKLKVTSSDLQIGPMPTLPTVDDMGLFKGWKSTSDASLKGAFDDIARPKLDASIGPARDKLMQSADERDQSRQKMIAEAQAKTADANAEARAKQASEVQGARTKIAAEQQNTLSKQKAAVADVESKANTKRSAAMAEIDTRVQGDQAKIQTQYQQAQEKADSEQQRGEAEAQQKREEAEKQASEGSWWDRAVHAVTSAISAVASAIDHVLTAVRDAVGHIIDAVKSAACAIIDAARNFIVSAISAFGDWLKDLVNATIGQLFPELAAQLNRYIDGAVQAATAAVNAIADGLKKAVTALLDGLKAGINTLINAYRAAVQAAATFATALVTGDWALVGKMVLEAALRLCGIDPAAFYALVGEARETINMILDDPGAFAGHVVDAVKLGFSQFGDNFLAHLRDGIVQWLFGAFAQGGITLPTRFDIAGVFDLVCQVLGLTYPRLRQKAVRLIGEQNVERIEFVWQYVEALLTGGWAGLWEKIQGDLSNLWSVVIDGAKSWLMEHIVQAAIIKLATMWNPAGAIVQLLLTAWNVYQWVKENAQRIFGLIQAVVHSMSEIAHGNIANAANFIENSLARLIPIAISLLADLLGLSGISDRIREIIESIQAAVDHALDQLIDRVLAMFSGGAGDKDKKEKEKEFGEPVQFESKGTKDAPGHSHKLWIEKKDDHHQVMVASEQLPAADQITRMTGQVGRLAAPDQAKATEDCALATSVLGDLNGAVTALEDQRRTNPMASDQEVRTHQASLSQALAMAFGHFEAMNSADLLAACTTAGGVALAKYNDLLAAAGLVNWAQFVAGATHRLELAEPSQRDPLRAMLDEISANPEAYLNKGAEIDNPPGLTRVVDIRVVYDRYLDPGLKAKFPDFGDYFAALKDHVEDVDPASSLDESAELAAGPNDPGLWINSERMGNIGSIFELRTALPTGSATYDRGYARFEMTAAEVRAHLREVGLALHRPTAWDGVFVYSQQHHDPVWQDAPAGAWGASPAAPGSAPVEQGSMAAVPINKIRTRRLVAIPTVARGGTVNQALDRFRVRQWPVGDRTVYLDREGMRHILERHHPRYWNGSIRQDQSFLDPDLTVNAVADLIGELVAGPLRDQIAQAAADPAAAGAIPRQGSAARGGHPHVQWNLQGQASNGVSYQIGFQSAPDGEGIINVGQFYPAT